MVELVLEFADLMILGLFIAVIKLYLWLHVFIKQNLKPVWTFFGMFKFRCFLNALLCLDVCSFLKLCGESVFLVKSVLEFCRSVEITSDCCG